MKSIDLEERLVDFSVMIIKLTENLTYSKASGILTNQIIRSGTSPSLNYGEARGAESKRDFVHKMQICLKELRETYISLKIIKKANLCKKPEVLGEALEEGNELISVFVKSVETTKRNMK